MKSKQSWSDRIKISHRLMLIGALAVVCLLLSGGIHMYSVNFLKDKAHENDELASVMEKFDTLHSEVRKAQDKLQDFLRTGDVSAYQVWKQKNEDASEALARLTSNLPDDSKLPQESRQIQSLLEKERDMALQAIELRKKLGLTEKEGLRGQLRDAVHAAEKELNTHHLQALTISMLMMRRHEKDFMLRGKDKYLKQHEQEYQHFQSLLRASALSTAAKQRLKALMASYHDGFQAYVSTYHALVKEVAILKAFHQQKLDAALNQLDDEFGQYIHTNKEASYAAQKAQDQRFMVLIAVLLLLLVASLMWVSRSMLAQIRELMGFAERIASGNLEPDASLRIRPHAKGELQMLLALMERMRVNLAKSVEAMRKQANDALRIQHALDVVGSNVMIADEDYRIFYMNTSLESMLKDNEKAFRTVLPNFDVNKLIGSSIDDYHQNPSHQRRMLDALKSTYASDDLLIAGRRIRITATPVFNEQGERIATVTEWQDRTDQLASEAEVDAFVTAAAKGSFDVRMVEEGKEGFFLKLAESLNSMGDVLSMAFSDTTRALQAMEEGDLTYRITTEYQGVYDEIKQAANNTAEKLATVLKDVRQTAMNVADGSSEIAQGNTTLSDRTQEQAAALEQTSASVEELTGTVQQNADNARQANQLAVTTSEQAEKGQVVVKQAIDAVEGISQSSRKIADIIGVIDEIAFQTNLLALNAAVEAARAGEQGRGFAVVAGEVRTLAQRSAEAAKEIKGLINASVDSVEHGSKLVFDSGEALNDIVASVQKVTDIIAEIAAASLEQSTGLDQINKAITQLDSAVQQNAALVEETAASSANLDQESNELLSTVSEFHLGDDGQRTTRRKSAPVKTVKSPSSSAPQHTSSGDEAWEEF